ncbi:MAG TPA: hypothetical protein VNO32_17220 [Candidatus Acidoferrum sp.]|nr:hypothetical protein [Candidatus Acidoferrum sp.]
MALGVLGPFADELKSGVGEYRPGGVLARRRRGIHFDRLALGFGLTAQASGDAGTEQYIAHMLIADTKMLGDFGAVVSRFRERADLVRLCR